MSVGAVDVEERSDVSSDSGNEVVTSVEERSREKPRSRGRGRGRSSSRGRQAQPRRRVPASDLPYKSYDDLDTGNQLPPFCPTRHPGLHLDFPVLRGEMTRALDFFKLFFTDALLLEICTHTNNYAYEAVTRKQYYGDRHGAWKDTSPEEILLLISLILYFGLVNVSSFHRYWSTKSLYHGLWTRKIMSRDRFKGLMGMLHIVDAGTEDENDKLRKVRSMLETFRNKCKSLYQPFQHVAVDERMVKSKHRSGIRQYIKDKPTKLWVLADSCNGYTCDFDVYTG